MKLRLIYDTFTIYAKTRGKIVVFFGDTVNRDNDMINSRFSAEGFGVVFPAFCVNTNKN
jgi:hypothetical protein